MRRALKWTAPGWLCLCLAPTLSGASPVVEQMSAGEVVRRMVEMDTSRRKDLQAYTANRLYFAENKRFNKRAEVLVRETFSAYGTKHFVIASENGSEYIRRKVIDKLIEAELDSAKTENLEQTQMGPRNYRFRLNGAETLDGRPCFVMDVTPLQAKKYLIHGRIWVDQEDFAIARMEGRPAKSPSFWTKNVHIVKRYEKHGPFWLPASTESESEVMIAGASSLRIGYTDYRIKQGVK